MPKRCCRYKLQLFLQRTEPIAMHTRVAPSAQVTRELQKTSGLLHATLLLSLSRKVM